MTSKNEVLQVCPGCQTATQEHQIHWTIETLLCPACKRHFFKHNNQDVPPDFEEQLGEFLASMFNRPKCGHVAEVKSGHTDSGDWNAVISLTSKYEYHFILKVFASKDGKEYTKSGVEVTSERLKEAGERFMSVFDQAPKVGAAPVQ